MKPIRFLLVILTALGVMGCGMNPGSVDTPVKVTGNLKTADGKAITGVTLTLQPISEGAHPVTIPVNNGKFEAEAIPGSYTYSIQGKTPATLKGIPAKYLDTSMDRKIFVKADEQIDITLDAN